MGRPYTSSQVAWEYFMRGAELYRRYTPKDNAHARELFEKAIDLDPEFAKSVCESGCHPSTRLGLRMDSGP